MADSKPAVLERAAATPFLGASDRVEPHTKLIGLPMPLVAFAGTRLLPPPRDAAA